MTIRLDLFGYKCANQFHKRTSKRSSSYPLTFQQSVASLITAAGSIYNLPVMSTLGGLSLFPAVIMCMALCCPTTAAADLWPRLSDLARAEVSVRQEDGDMVHSVLWYSCGLTQLAPYKVHT